MQLAHERAVVLGFRGREPGFERTQGAIAVDGVFHRGAIERERLLRDVRDAPLRGIVELAFVGVQLAAQQGEQARLARAVRADEADALARIERDIGAFEQELGAPDEADLRKTNHGDFTEL